MMLKHSDPQFYGNTSASFTGFFFLHIIDLVTTLLNKYAASQSETNI